ncbi:MAG TPA: DNA mismatch repair protein MutS [Anaerolineales bacterium]
MSTNDDDISPIRKQYLEIKRQHPNAILFFRLGDFYETFDQDAEIAARELDIVLTSRNVAKGVRIPMAGIPHHAVENYLARLIERGYHVAICEQVGDQPIKGLFPRQVTRVVTPGTVLEPGLLPGDANNYLACFIVADPAAFNSAGSWPVRRVGPAPSEDLASGQVEAASNAPGPASSGRLQDRRAVRQAGSPMATGRAAGKGRPPMERPAAGQVDADSASAGQSETGQPGRAGVAYVDITTGEFAVTELTGADLQAALRAELIRLHPAEVLFPDSLAPNDGLPGHLTPWPAWHFEPGRCQEELLRHFEVASLDGFGLRGLPLAVRAAGAILQYLAETQPAALKLLTGLNTYSLSDFMALDASTRRNLELTETLRGGSVKGSLLGVLDQTVTPMGKRLILQWVSKPLLDVARIRKRQDGVTYFFEHGMLRAELRAALKPLGDLERLTNRIVGGSAQPRDLVAARATLSRLPALRGLFGEEAGPLESALRDFNLCAGEYELLEKALDDDPPATLQNVGVIQPGFSAELDGVVERSRHAREWIANLEAVERERTGIKSLKVGYNKVFGYYLEITHANTGMAPAEYIRKQTLVNAERYITPEMKEYEALVLNAEERIHEIEARLFREVCAHLAGSARRLLGTARALAVLDVLSSLAEAAALGGYVCPEVLADDVLEIHEGRHPVVEQSLSGERFVPNEVIFEPGERVRLITGPNMSGKSTLIRQVALIVLMAQVGSFVPADSARIGLVDRIFTRIGAQDEIHAGQSTFMVEMVEAANILHHATPRSLLILDEIGRGTSTYDGVSIAWAVVEYIHNHPHLRSKTLFATHYHELTQLADLLPGVRNYNVAVSESDGRVVFLHKIIPGGADRSYGIHVAQLAGLPRPVIQRADEILRQLEASSGKAVRLDPHAAQQLAFFPETNPMLDELKGLDINSLSPIEALNKLYEWQKKYSKE